MSIENQAMPALPAVANLPVRTFNEIVQAGEIVARCRLLGVSNPAEGFITVATCLQEGLSFLRFGQKYHIIEGKLSQKAEAMLAEFCRIGGDYTIDSRTPDLVQITFKLKSRTYTEIVKWEELKQEKFCYTKDGRTLKDNYSTPRRRMQMMWARAVSDGVRCVAPEVTQGTYTPEEIGDFEPQPVQNAQPVDEQSSRPLEMELVEEAAPAIPFNQPQQVATVGTPFELAQQQAAPTEGTTCRLVGPHNGKPWSDCPTDYLKAINATSYSPLVSPQDRKTITKILEERK